MGVSPRFSTPGHPERWNRTLKDMLSKNVQEHGSDWDLHLPFLLFAYREIPHSTTDMSPFQLVYGRLPSGPISLLKEVWVGERNIPTTLSRSVEKYLEDLIEKLRKAHEIAAETAEATQNNYASCYNLRSREKQFKVGDKVLVLLPSSTHKLMKTWIGPATIIEITRPYSAKVELDDGGIRELHFNKLRPYIARVGQVGLIFDQDSDFGDLHYAPTDMAQEVDRQINELLHLKLIEPSESEWAHPIVCVSKKNGSIRLCVDYRHLNSFTIADAYPMQNAKDLLFEVGQANYITVLDLTKGYWQIPMAEKAKPYTTFVTHHAINRTDKEPSSEYNPLNEVAEQAFTKLKAQLVKAPSLYTPDLSKPYQLYTDASATAIGACLSQNDEKGKENPIAFSLDFGAKIEVISDHNLLTYLTLTTPQSAKLTRWALALQRYNIAISYRKGVKHGNADALSGCLFPNCDENKTVVNTSLKSVPTSHDVNLRITQAFSHIGKGYSAIEKFCMVMNIDPFSSTTYGKCARRLDNAYTLASENIFAEIHREIKNVYENGAEIADLSVNFDGTWLTLVVTPHLSV
ncbi:hypothetical protein TNCV_98471 [Trichonephila clavipes]|nr:hypothetical protein TNCV_98471 [Trichonephila clavipes]